jgi:dUTP pyrophosphatase
MKFLKIRPVKDPNRGTKNSAGIDFFIPEDFPTTIIIPGKSVLIPSGIKANVPEGFAFIAHNKSGVATKKNLQVGASVVDEDYQGEIHIHLTNVGTDDIELNAGDKIVQFLLLPVAYEPVEIVNTFEELFDGVVTSRGSGGFGSTGEK